MAGFCSGKLLKIPKHVLAMQRLLLKNNTE